jgi:hypothetical protein
MWEALYPIFEWHDQSWLGQTISGSIWLFPAIETVHILAMAIMFGALLVLNLRMLGWSFKRQSLPLLSSTLMPFVNWGLIVMILSGYAMFASEALKCYANDGFKFKMFFLVLAVLLQYTWYASLVKKEGEPRGDAKAAAVLNFVFWFCVGAGGRAIGFV